MQYSLHKVLHTDDLLMWADGSNNTELNIFFIFRNAPFDQKSLVYTVVGPRGGGGGGKQLLDSVSLWPSANFKKYDYNQNHTCAPPRLSAHPDTNFIIWIY